MSDTWQPVWKGEFDDALLMKSWIEGDGIEVKMTADVKSTPLRDPGAHGVRSEYERQVLFVKEADVERAEELIEAYGTEGE